ncbi:MAG: EAL domain-containing protein, partial [Actinomycetota bacterium]|nr:EAL domain-containing protein [Actinomycetota bacterium]
MQEVAETHPGSRAAGRAPRRLGVAARLFGTIAVPITVLALVLGTSVLERHRDVTKADALSERVVVLERMVSLRSALFREEVAAEIFIPGRRPPALMLKTSEFGTQISERPEELVDATDAALAAIPPATRPFDQDDLDRARGTSTDGDAEAGADPFGEIGRAVAAAIDDDLRFVRESAIELGDVRLIRAGTVFQRSVELPDEAGQFVAALADLWSAPPAARPELQSAVVTAYADFEDSSDRFTDSITDERSTVARVASPVLDLPLVLRQPVDSAVSGALSAANRQAGSPPSVGSALMQGVDWILRVDAIRNDAAEAVTAAADDVAASAQASERWNAGVALAAVAVSVAAATLFGRSILGPVRRLTDHAQRIGSGQLDRDPLELHGPPEIVRASQAMNDVVDNLVLLEQKGHALARADFEDPSLQQQLPGRLGASLRLSMEVLADSIEQRESLQSRLRFEASHDSLTGLGNRSSLIHTLDRALTASTASVIFLDLNDFKGINDVHGHAVGDEVLRVVAVRLLSAAPARALVARLGGDEFVIALPGVDGVDEPLEVARRATSAVTQPIEIDGRTVEVGASAGVAVRGHGSCDTGVEALLRMADLAVYCAKLDPDDSIVLYDDELDRRLTHQRQLETSLAQALQPDRDELRLTFQPIVRSDDFTVRGVEALLRWDSPDGGAVAPDEFIPIAERSDLILDVDHWVIDHVLAQMARWSRETSMEPLTVSVNVSGRSLLDRSFVGRVTTALASSGIPAQRLQIEVTETALVSDLELAASQLTVLRALGVRIVIDDFGTGYTSVAHLRT